MSNKENNKDKFIHLINVDMIYTYLYYHRLTAEDFCRICGIEIKELNDILYRRLTSFPENINRIAEVMGVELHNLVNFHFLSCEF